MDNTKYSAGYYAAPGSHTKWASRERIEKPPVWCSVDLRDGNQALVEPMTLDQKLEFFQLLVCFHKDRSAGGLIYAA